MHAPTPFQPDHHAGTFSRRTFLTRTTAAAGAATIALAGSAFAPVGRLAGAQDFEAAAIYEYGEPIVINTDALNIRDAPGLDAAVVGTYPGGTTGTILDGPADADNYSWYRVRLDTAGATGWCAGVYLAPAPGGTPSSFTVIDGPLNLRDEAGLSTTVIGTYPTGSTGTYQGTGREIIVDGYQWIEARMDNDGQFGYVATDFIAMA